MLASQRPLRATSTRALRAHLLILFVNANPGGAARVRADREIRQIRALLRGATHASAFEIAERHAASPEDLRRALLELGPDVVHFSGHGKDGSLLFEGEQGKKRPVVAASFVELLALSKERVRIVILNACGSRAHAEALVEHIDCAIGMADEIPDNAAIAFSSAFYEAIAFGRSLREAFALGENAIHLGGFSRSGSPVMFTRASVDPAQIVLVAPVDPRSREEPPRPSDGLESRRPRRKVPPLAFVALTAVAIAATVQGIARWKSPSHTTPAPPTTFSGTPVDGIVPETLLPRKDSAAASVMPMPPPPTEGRLDEKAPAARPAAPPPSIEVSPRPPATDVRGTAQCKGTSCSLTRDQGAFDSDIVACLDAEVGGVPVRCMPRSHARGALTVPCDRSDIASAVPLAPGTYRWSACR
ncbi:CHAT domain-containing protein [Polyangium sp. 6x1]|uniref:CHAT domain-containing protein n=1 Tax=Polyangium sp. 6x1 TaxID=3042689 RepID=UPI00248267B3|nr:CHAT domain-containing protein [Polyangium sp. 6x1]MDI1443062.1 CHAT domain-containing protein [Polyangium sp. 6x1]